MIKSKKELNGLVWEALRWILCYKDFRRAENHIRTKNSNENANTRVILTFLSFQLIIIIYLCPKALSMVCLTWWKIMKVIEEKREDNLWNCCPNWIMKIYFISIESKRLAVVQMKIEMKVERNISKLLSSIYKTSIAIVIYWNNSTTQYPIKFGVFSEIKRREFNKINKTVKPSLWLIHYLWFNLNLLSRFPFILMPLTIILMISISAAWVKMTIMKKIIFGQNVFFILEQENINNF